MAFFDDRKFILSHIRHSFITSDPTETCEMVMLHESMPHFFGPESEKQFISSVEVEAKSELLDANIPCEIASDIDLIGAHRGRSNTAQRLERLKEEKKTAAKMKIIHWRDNSKPVTESQLEELFPRKSLELNSSTFQEKEPQTHKKSALSVLVDKFPDNPFKEYARFDARVGDRRRTRSYEIVLHILPAEKRGKSMHVVTLTNAKVRDLIGLTCWLYTNEEREPPLDCNLQRYCLKIAEDNGDIDTDFPSLNPNDMIEKYEFKTLALVESSEDSGAFVNATPLPSFPNINLGEIQHRRVVHHENRTTNVGYRRKLKSGPLGMFKKYLKGDKKHKKDKKS